MNVIIRRYRYFIKVIGGETINKKKAELNMTLRIKYSPKQLSSLRFFISHVYFLSIRENVNNMGYVFKFMNKKNYK
jgi:hypothetical protein